MMKMKFALAAGLTAAVFAGFCDGIESSNTVGYMGKETPAAGNVMIAPMFDNVGTAGKIKLSSIRGTGYDTEEGAWGDLCLAVLNKGGAADTFTDGPYVGQKKQFYWFDNEDNEPGWYDANGEVMFDSDTIEFSAGDGLWVQGGAQSVLTAGQVGMSNINVATPPAGNKAAGNPFPVTLKLSEIYGEGYDEEEGAWGDICLNVLNKGGAADTFVGGDNDGKKKQFYWFDNEDNQAGWYDANGEIQWDAEKIEFPAGQGLWIAGGGQTVVFPVPTTIKPVEEK